MLKLTINQKLLFQKFWKVGEFKIHRLFFNNRDKVFANWEAIGIVKRIDQFTYRINRSKFLELDKTEDQIKLFAEVPNK